MMNEVLYWQVSGILLVSALLFGCSNASQQPIAEEQVPMPHEENDVRVVMFMGDSLTAGFQLNPDVAFPALIQRKLDSLGKNVDVINAGVSGDTSADGRSRIQWLLRQPVDVFILALGANDALRGLSIEQLYDNLMGILDTTRSRYPEAKLIVAGMRMPANYGKTYTSAFEQVFADVANEFDAILIPFLLAGVAGNPEYNLADGIHPNEAGHRIMAETVWSHIAPLFAD